MLEPLEEALFAPPARPPGRGEPRGRGAGGGRVHNTYAYFKGLVPDERLSHQVGEGSWVLGGW